MKQEHSETTFDKYAHGMHRLYRRNIIRYIKAYKEGKSYAREYLLCETSELAGYALAVGDTETFYAMAKIQANIRKNSMHIYA